MPAEAVDREQVQVVFREWCRSRCSVYATVFDNNGMQTCAGQVASVDDEAAVIADALVELRVPYASAGDSAVACLDERMKSVTLTWRDGTSAFIVTR